MKSLTAVPEGSRSIASRSSVYLIGKGASALAFDVASSESAENYLPNRQSLFSPRTPKGAAPAASAGENDPGFNLPGAVAAENGGAHDASRVSSDLWTSSSGASASDGDGPGCGTGSGGMTDYELEEMDEFVIEQIPVTELYDLILNNRNDCVLVLDDPVRRSPLHNLVMSAPFSLAVLGLILLDTAQMGLQAELAARGKSEDWEETFWLSGSVMLSLFWVGS